MEFPCGMLLTQHTRKAPCTFSTIMTAIHVSQSLWYKAVHTDCTLTVAPVTTSHHPGPAAALHHQNRHRMTVVVVVRRSVQKRKRMHATTHSSLGLDHHCRCQHQNEQQGQQSLRIVIWTLILFPI